ncbi:hypothetical protein PQG02_21045 [Nostoc sp. UHCC 0926]|uniref:hypothetical protein n=1 Tax=unclassified Nostoc TaxID=2593658 RepID=UPI00235FB29B|nr:hypothetical protein [Nostoc sp. UHCC 0926]WDD31199.1 hypothetical protein PQG02_21045 [Nostoc sp. UHCC 0926]
MNKLIPSIGLLAIALLASSCESQVIAQSFKPVNQLPPVNTSAPSPAPNPEDANRQFPTTSRATLGFPPLANPAADIGERDAAQRAISIAVADFGESKPRVINNSVMSYREALRQGSEPVEVSEDDPLVNTQVRIVEISGNFQVRGRRQKGASTSTEAYTKGYIILRAADGLQLAYHLFK